jgi:1-deoxy-D-xylulose-5-phosphate reductoisomerase
MQNIAILGATGSIGRSALAVIANHPDRYRAGALAAGSDAKALAAAALAVRPQAVAIADEAKRSELAALLAEGGWKGEILSGPGAAEQLAADARFDTVIHAIVGAAGVRPAFAAAAAGKRLLLANKESVVCGGEILMRTVRESGATLLPVDSEHNAIFQCLHAAGSSGRDAARIWLTCSGGPFHARPEVDLARVTPEQALAHPTWKMGRKISIDSATLMNKGLEVIEAHHLFDFPPERISVVIHPQSVVHSMVEFADGAVVAELGTADMKLPIAYCLAYPERIAGDVKRLDITRMGPLTFSEPDTGRFPLLALAFEAISSGAASPIILNGANEVAVEAFLAGKIGFAAIGALCRDALDALSPAEPSGLEDILEIDRMAREAARSLTARHAI